MAKRTAKTKKRAKPPRLDLSEAALAKLDPETRARRRVLREMRKMTPSELFAIAVRAGIYTKDGKLTKPYRSNEPSACRPTD
jgi:hypothetical protein